MNHIEQLKEYITYAKTIDFKAMKSHIGVTKLISTVDKKGQESLKKWREKVGEKEAEKITTVARQKGISLDRLVETYFINPEQCKPEQPGDTSWMLFEQLLPHLKCFQCLGTQVPVWSDIHMFKGYLDFVALEGDTIWLVDIKNSKSIKQKAWVENYFLQCTFYCMALFEQTKIPVSNIGVYIANRSVDFPTIFREKTTNYFDIARQKLKEYKEIKNGNLQ